LRRLPKTHWTLLVQGVDRLVPAVAALARPFRFLPDWRIDDVMVSFAAPQGSVGPHVDSYDVFLLQGMGRRRWAISTRAEPAFRSGLDLRILRRFEAEESRVLQPGDMLYLPPGVGHHGVALEDGLTFSIGFRAPSGRELLAAALRRRAEDPLYRDPALRPARHPGEITPAARRRLRRLAHAALDRALPTALGELVTEPKDEPAHARPLRRADLARRLREGSVLVRRPGARVAFQGAGRDAMLFAEGRSFPLGRSLAFAGPLLSGAFRLSAASLQPHMRDRGFVELLAGVVATGAFALRRGRGLRDEEPPAPV
jgi:50S ribosomal protein L16 3-hydroxylase